MESFSGVIYAIHLLMINTVRNMYDTFNVRLSEYVRDLIREYLSIFQRDRALNLACTHDLVIAKPKD